MGISNFSGLKPIEDKLNSHDTDIKAKIGSDADAVTDTTLHAKAKDIQTKIGSDADASSAAGSIHAKLKDVRNNLPGGGSDGMVKEIYIYDSTALGSWETKVNVTGKGLLEYAWITCNTSDSTNKLKVTIDGTNVLEVSTYASTNPYATGLVNVNHIGAAGTDGYVYHFATRSSTRLGGLGSLPYTSSNEKAFLTSVGIPFNSSLKIETYHNSNSIYVYGMYYLL